MCLKAIKAGEYATWTGLTWEAENNHFPESKETEKGHMRNTNAGVGTTKIPIPKPGAQEEDEEPQSTLPSKSSATY